MNQDFMDSEIFADFIIESREHLESIEPNLLELEKAPDNLDLLNEIFRPMHSLKGASGFMGLNKINALAHRSENILDELRKGTMSVNAEIMDVILAATDALRQMLDNLEETSGEGDVDINSLIETLDALMAGETPPAQAEEAAGEKSAPAEDNADSPDGQQKEVLAPMPAEEPFSQPEEDDNLPVDRQAWIDSLQKLPSYALTAFGESHLKDFIDESVELLEELSSGLVELDDPGKDHTDLVNDLFRCFHNLKGNSGIIGYNEINRLTHEAETLLNSVRKGEMQITPDLVDLLLSSVDALDILIKGIDLGLGSAAPVDVQTLVEKLEMASSGKGVSLPFKKEGVEAKAASQPAGESVQNDADADEDTAIFKSTIAQQKSAIAEALAALGEDGTQKEYIDALYRSLTTIQNSCNYMGFDEPKNYAGITAGIVDQGRKSDLDFALMVDMMDQESAIIYELIDKALGSGKATAATASSGKEEPQGQPAGAASPAVEAEQEPSRPVAEKDSGLKKEPVEPEAEKEPAPEKTDTAPKAQAKPVQETPKPAPAAPKPAASAAAPGGDAGAGHKASSTIRVDHEKLDHLMNLIGELIINRNRYSLLARQLEENNDVDISEVAQNLSETTYSMARISDELQDTIMKVRMVPVSSVFSRFPRLVRDLSRKSGKDVELIMEGEETELDKSVVEVIGDPLVHLIRNSMDHGIEHSEDRIAAGKPAQGKVWLRASHRGNSVAIEIEDDGKGIDPEKMRQVAVKKGLMSMEEAKQLDDHEAIELIFAPGFSSAEKITDISGRGVGMDVVRTNIKNLKGSVSVTSEIDKGSRITLSLPLTLAIIDALMIDVAGELFAIPLDSVSETTKIEASRLTDVKGRKAVTLRGEVLGIMDLRAILALPSCEEEREELSIVVIHDNNRRLGLVVDRLLERQEIVIKPLGEYLGNIEGISGATILGDGGVILILDPHEIYLMATSKTAGRE